MKKNLSLLLCSCLLTTALQAQPDQTTAEIDSIVTLAFTAQRGGKLYEAYELASAAKEKCEQSIGKMTTQYASCLHVISVYLGVSGQLDQAVPVTLEALEIRRTLLGSRHEDYGKTLNNLVVQYFDLGLYEKALPLAEESLALQKELVGPEHPENASSLINLGKVHFGLRNYAKSVELLEQALVLREKQLGVNHPRTLGTLQLLGSNYIVLKEGKKAVAYNERAVALTEQMLQGRPDITLPMTMQNLAMAYALNGQFELELALQPQMDSLLDLATDRTNPLWVQRYNAWTRACRRNGKTEEAVEWALKTQAANAAWTLDKAVWMSGEDLYEQHQQSNDMVHEVFSLAADHAAEYPAFAQSCYDDALLYKGIGLSSQRFFERELSQKNVTASQEVQEWKRLRKQLSEAEARPGSRSADETAALKNNLALLESRLIKNLGGFTQMRYNPTWQDVQAALRPGEVAVEFLRFTYFQPTEITARDIRYLALVLRPGDAAPAAVPICFDKEMLPLLPPDSLRNEQVLHDLYHGITKNETGKSLADLLWSPLEPLLRGAKTIYYSPAGNLHRVNFAALAPDGKTPLTERLHFRPLLSTRSLATPRKSTKPTDALLFGGIRFDADSLEMKTALDLLRSEGSILFSTNAGGSRGDDSRGRGKWRYLRGTEKEVNDIGQVMERSGFVRVEKRMGAQACEERLKVFSENRKSPGVLHIATHGFALADVRGGSAANAPRNPFSGSGNSMNRAGLVLAGGNHTWLGGKYRQGMEDGILTASEISQLDFSATELVALSACESGLGEVRGAEGVLGLQRSFKIAGAHHLLLSLWQVPDQETQEFMSMFYRAWLEKKLPVPEAFRAAQAEMRRLYPTPFYWAGFVLTE